MINVITPPNLAKNIKGCHKSVFLAGSIEMGLAEKWQDALITDLELHDFDLVVYNPRRADWDSTWVQEAESPQFYQQVTWELMSLEKCDHIFLYLDPPTKSPISLLELGLYAKSGKLIVCCPDEFWRKGNVDIVCNMYGVPLFDDKEKAIVYLKKQLNK